MSIKITRAKSISKIGDCHQLFADMAAYIPNAVFNKLSSREIATMIDALWDCANKSKLTILPALHYG